MKFEWNLVRLGDIADVQSGGTPLVSNPDFWNGDIAWYSSGELNVKYTCTPDRHISQLGIDNSNAKLFPKGSLLIGMYDTAALKMSILDRDAAFNQAIAGVRPNSQIDLSFVQYAIDSHREYILGQRRGVRQKNLSLAKIRDIELWLPPLSEQQLIVAIIDEAFEAIAVARANAEQNRQNARALFESYLQSVFSQRGDGWINKPLSELCDIKHGFAFKSEYFTNEGDYTLLTPGNFFETGGYRDRGDKQKFYSGDIPQGFLLEAGDLLVAMTEQAAGLLGSPIIVPSQGKFLHNQRLGLVSGKLGIPWLNEFFFHVFNTQAVRQAIHESASGAKVRHTSPTKIGAVTVAFPASIEEQKAIVATLDTLTIETQRLESLYQRKIAALDELKQSLLQQAFSGQL